MTGNVWKCVRQDFQKQLKNGILLLNRTGERKAKNSFPMGVFCEVIEDNSQAGRFSVFYSCLC